MTNEEPLDAVVPVTKRKPERVVNKKVVSTGVESVRREQVTETSVAGVTAWLERKYDDVKFHSAKRGWESMVFRSGNTLIKTELVESD